MLTTLRRKLRPLRLMAWCIKGLKNSSPWEESDEKLCWLIGGPDHRNLGDHAIAYATKKYISKVLPDYTVREITENEFYGCFLRMRKALKQDHILILQGGGNFGNQYQDIENIRRVVVSSCKKNPIIMFPQTIYFLKNKVGDIEKNHTRRLYNKNNNIQYFAREAYSAEYMKELFAEEKVHCVPDIVLSLENENVVPKDLQRSGIICCLRNDQEGVLTAQDRQQITKLLNQIDTVKAMDTINTRTVSPQNREKELEAIWQAFASAKLVVTDRLHGMIFAAITHTPCIVFSNYNKKVLGVYEWIDFAENILFLGDPKALNEKVVTDVMQAASAGCDKWEKLQSTFAELEKKLLEASRKNENKKVY